MATPRMAWRRKPRETGLSGMVYNSTRGWELRRGEEDLASIGFLQRGFSRETAGFYWVTSTNEALGIPWRNTSSEGRVIATLEEAKAEAMAYVRECLAKAVQP